jgi:branched-chain amino acid transport system ATP-binding protein
MPELLRVQSVLKQFGGLVALNDVSIKLDESRIHGLIGPNGSGKTTLMNIISGLIKPERGRIFYKEDDITGKAPHKIASMGIARTFQNPRVFSNLTVRENIIAVIPAEQRNRTDIDEILSIAGLSELGHVMSKNLDYGQKKQLEFARALALDAELIMLDEPMAGLDLELMGTLSDTITRVHREYSKTFLIIEHHLEELMKLVDWVFVLDNGNKIAEGRPDSISQDQIVLSAYFGTV